MLAMALTAAVLGLVIGSRAGIFGLLLGAVFISGISQSGFFHANDTSWWTSAGLLAVAVITFQLAAFAAMLIRYLTFGSTRAAGSRFRWPGHSAIRREG
jgi:hypothetical protein